MGDAAILMYHRVCEPTPAAQCYFTRGTAVRPEVFDAQLEWLRARFPIVSLSQWLDGSVAPIERCVILTFDDGYLDAATAMSRPPARDLPYVVFPVASHLGDSPRAIWVDEYYAVLHSAQHPPTGTWRERWPDAPAVHADRRWWVRGPVKEHLQVLPPDEREGALDDLRAALGAANHPDLARDLYVRERELHLLVARGIDVGGHGATHTRLTVCPDDQLVRELDASIELLSRIGTTYKVLAYPDGRHDLRVREMAHRKGFEAGLTVEPGFASLSGDRMALPRFFVRDVLPGDGPWCDAFC